MTTCGRRLAAVVAAGALVLAGCSTSDDNKNEYAVAVVSDPAFPAGTTMDKLHSAGKIRIGVKFDQPGIGYKEPGSSVPSGFDIEVAKIIAGQLGISSDGIEWVETVSQDREAFLRDGKVDIVVASYTITDERRELVGMAGPYYVTGQQLLVRSGDDSISGPKDVKGRKVCSATGSQSLTTIQKKYGATTVPLPTYSKCVDRLLNGSVDAVTTDGAILRGFAAQEPEKLAVVGKPFTTSDYGVGYRKNDRAMCEFIDTTLNDAFDDMEWDLALLRTLFRTTNELPDPPKTQPCS